MASLSPSHGSPVTPISETSASTAKRPASTLTDANVENRRKNPKTSRACDVCKKKKIRCDGTFPCRNCDRRRLVCAYDAKYGRGRAPTPRRSMATSSEGLQGTSTVSQQPGNLDYEDGPVQVHVRASPDMETELEMEGQYFDLTSGLNFLHRAWNKLLTAENKSSSYNSSNGDRRQHLTSAGDQPFHVDECALEDDLIPDAATARKLQEFYFDTCVVTYCLFHRQSVEKWMDTLLINREERRPITHLLGHARVAILLTIMAIATLRQEKVKGNPRHRDNSPDLRRSDQLFCAAAKLTGAEFGFPRLESAQARLIQVLYLLQTSRMNRGWYTLGNTFQIALSLGMHRARNQQRDFPFTNQRQNYITSECVKRTFWVSYILDRYLSVIFGRPRLYQNEDIDQYFPDSVNDEDMTPQGQFVSDESGDCPVDGLIFHAKISRIIGKISRGVYSVSDMSECDRLATARQFIQEIHDWRVSLPPHLGAVKPSTLLPSFRRQAIALQLAYAHAIVHVTRPFLLNEEAPDAVAECIAATRESLKLMDKMAHDSILLHSFWWAPYVAFCALAVVYVWEIQQARRSGALSDGHSFGEIFDLADKCQERLDLAATGLSQNQRYSVILGELRSEAQRCRHSRENEQSAPQSCHHVSQVNPSSGFSFSAAQDTDMMNIAHSDLPPDGFSSNVLDTFVFSDWLALDSSAFFPLSDPNSVSPPYFATMP